MVHLVIFGLAVLAAACSNGPRDDTPAAARPPPPPPARSINDIARVTIATPQGEVEVQVEVVRTPAKIAQGLMYRTHLEPNAGMLFCMGHDSDHAFYMRNTLIPLDMIFITRDLSVAGFVANATPRTETLRRVGKPSRYVLEVNAGWAARHGVTAGARVQFHGIATLPGC